MTNYQLLGRLEFETAFHIGSGQEGEFLSDRGILRNHLNQPVLPGSTLKGKLRATAEQLAMHLKLRACLMDTGLSGISCLSARGHSCAKEPSAQALVPERLDWIKNNSCDICWLFGSPKHGSRVFCSDGSWNEVHSPILVRHGVALDRDSGTAVPKLKYDYEVVPGQTGFDLRIDIEEPEEHELALLAATLVEWQQGFRLGAMKSRGLGLAKLKISKLLSVDLSNHKQRLDYFIHKRWQSQSFQFLIETLEAYLGE